MEKRFEIHWIMTHVLHPLFLHFSYVFAVVVLVDMSDKWTRSKLDYEVLKCLALNSDVPAILVLNKVLAMSFCIDLSQS